MRDTHLKSLVISALCSDPALSRLHTIRNASDTQHRRLLRWLDQSGLALYFLNRLQQLNAAEQLPHTLRRELETRLAANRQRSADMFDEFRRVTNSFTKSGVTFCAIKGLSLVPESCPAQHLRHQTDFDFLISPRSLTQATRALVSQGYVQQEIRTSGEVIFSTPQTHVPTGADDIYARPRHREIDVLPSLQLDFHGASISTRMDQLARVRTKRIEDLSFPVLAADDMFVLQVLHAFSHLLGSWVRLSWLLEIAYFLEVHHQDHLLWHSVIEREQDVAQINGTSFNRNAFGLILSLTQEIFPSSRPLPSRLHDWCIQSLPIPIQAWIRHFGRRFAHADLNGSKVSLFVYRDFVATETRAGRQACNRYLLRRIFPVGRRSSIGKVSIATSRAKIRANVYQRLHSVRRALFHLCELVSFPVEAIRWKRALRSLQRQLTRTLAQSDSVRSNSGTCSGKVLGNLARYPD
jgi:hypothetical protein